MTRVFQLAAYRRLLVAYILNELAWSSGSVALALLVYRRTGSAIGTAGFFLCSQFVPALSSPALVARLDQRAAGIVLPGLYAVEAVLFVALAWFASHFSLVAVLALALADGIVALTARSLSRAATVAVTSPVSLLREGNAVTNTASSLCFMAGPAIGGAVVLAGGVSAALLVSVALFALTTLTLAGMGGLPGPEVERTPAVGRLGAALRHAVAHPAIRSLLSLQAAALLFFTISIPVEVVFAQHSLHAGAGGYGGLLASWGAGSIAGSLIYARWRRHSARALITIGAGALGLGFVGMALSPTLTVALLCAALAGSGNGIEAVAARTALQERVEADRMTLMMSLNESMFQAVPGAGILLGGALAAIGSPRLALAVAGTGALAVTAAAWIVLRPGTPSGPPAGPLGPGGADGHDVVNGRPGSVSGTPTSAGRGPALG